MYKIIRSKRKTLAIKVCDDGSVIIKAPRFASKAQIYSFINTKTDWIENIYRNVWHILRPPSALNMVK